jgi:hypothetical protein
MSSRKQTYVHFVEGKKPRIYVNPENKEELLLKGTLVKKPKSKKLATIPVENWKCENGTIIAKEEKGQTIVKVESYIQTKVEDESMKKSQKIEELIDQLESIKVEILKVQEDHKSELEKFKGKGKSIKYLVAIILLQSATLIYSYYPQIESLLK